MGQIYISYRRDDSAAISGRIADRLRAAFGAGATLKDVGVERAEALGQCSAVVVVIGPQWLSGVLADPAGQTTSEVETALRLGLPVIPALVHGATLPDARLLAPALWPLVARGAITIGPEPRFDQDMVTLGQTLARSMPPQGFASPAQRRSRRAPALPGEVGAQVRRATLGRRAFTIALVVAVLLVSCVGGTTLLARRLSVAGAFDFLGGDRLYDIANQPGTNDAWAVGGDHSSCAMLHYTGGRWASVNCPGSGELDSISFVNSGEGWAVGGDYEGCHLIHFHAGSWSNVTCPVQQFSDTPVVRMDTQGNGWIVGGETVLRYTGSVWRVYGGALPLGGMRGMGASGAGDAWALSDAGFRQAIGDHWTAVQTPQLGLDDFYEDIDFSRTGDQGWVVGYTPPLQRAAIAEYQNGAWIPFTPLPSVGELTLVRVGLFGDVWAAGGAEGSNLSSPHGLIVRYDGQRWTTLGDPLDGEIHGITDLPDGDAWAVGDTANLGAALLWYHNGFWRIYYATPNN